MGLSRIMSDEGVDSVLGPSDPETQFVPQEDDYETLWEVVEITGEKKQRYKIRWKGNNPVTGKPWPQSWVDKHDCTDNLVQVWELKQAKKRKGSKQESGISKKLRMSAATAESSTSALTSKRTASPLKMGRTGSSRRSTTTTTAVNARRSRSKATVPSPSVHKAGTRSRDPVETYSPSSFSYRLTPSCSSVDMSLTDDSDAMIEPMRSIVQQESPNHKEEEEVDARMSEDSLSDIYCSSRQNSTLHPDHSQEDEATPTPPVRSAHGQEGMVEDTPTVSRPQRETPRDVDGDAIGGDDHSSPTLSPDFATWIELRQLRQQLEDGAILDKVDKGKEKEGEKEMIAAGASSTRSYSSLENAKSEEISRLEGQLSAAQRANEDLHQRLSALAVQAASWEKERAALVLDIERATRGKGSAVQDRDFFREQYVKASGFVSSVRDENAELEKRTKIATDQAQSGVSLIKATFKLRTKSLEEDVRAWRRTAEFLMEKDRRTNDAIRKRAAEEPELRVKCDRQESVLKEIAGELERLVPVVEEKNKRRVEAEEVAKRWKAATVKLNLELHEAKMKLERNGKGIGDGDESAQSNGHEIVYRCQWKRPDDSNDACEAVFLNISELQEHLYAGGHLQLD